MNCKLENINIGPPEINLINFQNYCHNSRQNWIKCGKAIQKEEAVFVEIPVIRAITAEDSEVTFLTIKEDIIDLVDGMITQMQADPEMAQLIVNKQANVKED